MNEIAKCPLCGEEPMELVAVFGRSLVAIACCGAEFRTREHWDQYAAAMELARSTVSYNHCAPHDESKHIDGIQSATVRVIKVFGGE